MRIGLKKPDEPQDRPIPNTYWVIPGRLLAGEYPAGTDFADSRERLKWIQDAGIDYFVDLTEVDIAPRPVSEIRPSPPPLAVRQHVQGSVVVTVLVSESGGVLDAKILSGIGRFGVDEAALRAVRSARFSPGVKNGKRVRVWMPLRFEFKL